MARWWDPSLSVLWVLRPKLWASGPHGVTAGLQVAPFDWQVPSLVDCLVQYPSACEPIFSTLHGGFNSSVDQVVGWLGETQGLENGPSPSGSQLPSRAEHCPLNVSSSKVEYFKEKKEKPKPGSQVALLALAI